MKLRPSDREELALSQLGPWCSWTETQVFGPFSSTLTVETGLISMSIGTLHYKNKGHELGQPKPQTTCINRLSFPTAESAEGQLCPATRNLSLPLSALLLSATMPSDQLPHSPRIIATSTLSLPSQQPRAKQDRGLTFPSPHAHSLGCSL